ncbi:MAG TPA: carboxypeptidase-like regulatory domain-containing protein, partial [Chryseosolibacter sp.]|nr:carboxypeptidase-like regulatory domain-containing protein [Chryseosolibacter sp.]
MLTAIPKRFGPKHFLAALFLFLAFVAQAQTIVKGKVMDSNSGDPIPFANVIFQGTTIGTTTDFDGNFTLKASVSVDSIVASYLGYKTRAKKVIAGVQQVINFQLEEEVTRLQEIVFDAGENPAFEILRNVIKNKAHNDKRRLSAYEY